MPKLIDDQHHDPQIDALITSMSQLFQRVELLADSCCETDEDARNFYAKIRSRIDEHPYEHVHIVFDALCDPKKGRTLGSATGQGPMAPDYHSRMMEAAEKRIAERTAKTVPPAAAKEKPAPASPATPKDK